MVVHAYVPSIHEAEAGRLLQIWGQSGIRGEFNASQSYIAETLFRNKSKSYWVV